MKTTAIVSILVVASPVTVLSREHGQPTSNQLSCVSRVQGGDATPQQSGVVVLGKLVEPLVPVALGGHSAGRQAITGFASGSGDGGRPVLNSAHYYQAVSYDKGGTTVTVLESERSPDDGLWHDTARSYATAFSIEYVSWRTADELYVFGVSRNADDVIEKWTITALDGEYKAALATSPTGIGTPRSGALDLSLEIVGGVFVPPPQRQRTSQPTDTREEIYRGSAFGGTVCAAVDPDGRFLILLGRDERSLYQVPLAEGASPSVLYTTNEIPDLVKIGSIGRGLHSSGSRALILTPAGNPNWFAAPLRVPIFDEDNDGVFDYFVALTLEQWDASLADTWIDDYCNYY